VLEQLQRGQWEAARQTLAALAARAPDVPRYRALLSYARGREAQLAHRLDEARVELQDALQIDPELQLAKTALAELFTRRK
jgi:Tfp pilus assembly protein PilF